MKQSMTSYLVVVKSFCRRLLSNWGCSFFRDEIGMTMAKRLKADAVSTIFVNYLAPSSTYSASIFIQNLYKWAYAYVATALCYILKCHNRAMKWNPVHAWCTRELSRFSILLADSSVQVEVLVTDRHKQIAKYIREHKPSVDHHYDVWHVSKGIYNNFINVCVPYSGKLWRISEIVCQQVKLWQFLGERVGSMQVNKLCKFTVTLTASRKLVYA